jgi:predicted DNA-binding transcriptional regulator AlpA
MITDVDHLVGAAEIQRMFGVSRQRIQMLVNRDDFPNPEVVLAMGKVWRTDHVKAWAREHGRTVIEDPEDGQ